MNPTLVPLSQLNSSEIAHDVFALAALSIPVLLFMHKEPLLGLLVGGFELAVFYSLGGPRLTL